MFHVTNTTGLLTIALISHMLMRLNADDELEISKPVNLSSL